MGIDVRDPDQPVGTLSGGERQAVAIARAVYFGAKVLILDEPTSALGVKQSGVVLRYVAQARDRGLGVIFITHNPHHAYPVGDRFVILNRGRLMGDWRKGEITRDELVKQMSGGAELDALEHELRSARSRHERDDETPARRRDRAGAPAHRRRGDRLRLAGPGPQPLAAAHPDAVRRARVRRRARRLRRHRCPSAARTRCARSASRAATADWRAVVDDPAVDVVVHRRAEHAPRRAGRGRGRGRQARVLREAGRRHAGADGARRAGRARARA